MNKNGEKMRNEFGGILENTTRQIREVKLGKLVRRTELQTTGRVHRKAKVLEWNQRDSARLTKLYRNQKTGTTQSVGMCEDCCR
jgi:hypothetical protein